MSFDEEIRRTSAPRLVPAIRLAYPGEQPSDARIPFSTVNPAGLVAMREWLADEAVDVDELTLGRALAYYFEVSES